MTNFNYDEINDKLNRMNEILINVSNLRNSVTNGTNELINSIDELEKKLIMNQIYERNDSNDVKLKKRHSILIYINILLNKKEEQMPRNNCNYLYLHNILSNEYSLLYQQLCQHPLYYLENPWFIAHSGLGTCLECRCVECGKLEAVPIRELRRKIICNYRDMFGTDPKTPSISFSEAQKEFTELKAKNPKEAVRAMLKKHVHYL